MSSSIYFGKWIPIYLLRVICPDYPIKPKCIANMSPWQCLWQNNIALRKDKITYEARVIKIWAPQFHDSIFQLLSSYKRPFSCCFFLYLWDSLQVQFVVPRKITEAVQLGFSLASQLSKEVQPLSVQYIS